MKSLLTKLSAPLLATFLLSGCMSALWDGLPANAVAPELSHETWLNYPTDEELRLEDLRGAPVLLEFWSMDCPPCREHVPVMQRLQAGYSDEELQLVSVHLDLDLSEPAQDVETVADFVARQGIEYPVGIDQQGAAWQLYDFGYLPHAVLLDEHGQVVWSGNLVVHDVEQRVEQLLGAPALESAPTAQTAGILSNGVEEAECEGGVCAPR